MANDARIETKPPDKRPDSNQRRKRASSSSSLITRPRDVHDQGATLEQLEHSELVDLYQVILGAPTRNMSRRVLVTRIRDAVRRHLYVCGFTTDTPASKEPGPPRGPRPSALLDSPIGALTVAQLQLRYRWLTGRQTRARSIRDLRVMVRRAERGEVPAAMCPPATGGSPESRTYTIHANIPVGLRDELAPLCDRLGIPNRADLMRQALYWYLVELNEHELARKIVPSL